MATFEKRESRGKTVIRARIRIKGAPDLQATFPNKTLARDWANKTETDIKEGKYLPTMKAQRHTLGELIDTYKESAKNTLRAGETSFAQLDVWKDQLGAYSLATITPERIHSTLNEIAAIQTPSGRNKSPATLNRYLGVLSSALTFGVKNLGWLNNNPAFKVSKKSEPQGRVRHLSDIERKRLLTEVKKANNPFLYPVVVLAISTGARRGEIMNLKWSDVDLDREWATLQETKNGERRGLPIKGLALDLLRALRADHHSEIWVFPNGDNSAPFDIRRSWEKAKEDAQVPNFRFHDLRHTFASYLLMDGASLGEIADAMGHKTLQMVKRYAHISDTHKASVVERMNNKIFGDTE